MDNSTSERTPPEDMPPTSRDLFVLELDERLEFGVINLPGVFDSNSSCTNLYPCTSKDNTSCLNATCLSG
jgi:hypothetical protein